MTEIYWDSNGNFSFRKHGEQSTISVFDIEECTSESDLLGGLHTMFENVCGFSIIVISDDLECLVVWISSSPLFFNNNISFRKLVRVEYKTGQTICFVCWSTPGNRLFLSDEPLSQICFPSSSATRKMAGLLASYLRPRQRSMKHHWQASLQNASRQCSKISIGILGEEVEVFEMSLWVFH